MIVLYTENPGGTIAAGNTEMGLLILWFRFQSLGYTIINSLW